MHIIRYEPKFENQWNEFVLCSKNGTFLLLRNYMDYHKTRFIDMSLMICDETKAVIALLPASLHEDTLISHQGLTYGGLIYDFHMTQPIMLNVFQVLIDFLIQKKIRHFIYKTIPRIYHRGTADEDHYALFLLNATLKRRDILTVFDTAYPVPFQTRRKRTIKKAARFQLKVQQSIHFDDYWTLLIENLKNRYGVPPVHTLIEINLLAQRFPNHIKLFNCYDNQQQLLAGVVVYETDSVAHFQYIASSAQGKLMGALDWLFSILIQDIYAKKRYIDFGISNENEGRLMNQGLIDYKEGFGGRSVAHDFYHLELKPYLLQTI